jgi:hypothetical protein
MRRRTLLSEDGTAQAGDVAAVRALLIRDVIREPAAGVVVAQLDVAAGTPDFGAAVEFCDVAAVDLGVGEITLLELQSGGRHDVKDGGHRRGCGRYTEHSSARGSGGSSHIVRWCTRAYQTVNVTV